MTHRFLLLVLIATSSLAWANGGSHSREKQQRAPKQKQQESTPKKQAQGNTQTIEGLFANFQEVLDKHLSKCVSKNEKGEEMVQTAFDYDAALNDKTTRTLMTKQQKALEAFKNPPDGNDNKFKAFWINAYNYFMLAAILGTELDTSTDRVKPKHGSVKDYAQDADPKDEKEFKIFKKKGLFKVGGASYTLNQIEHEMLIKKTKDARIHFAVNCASVGCPPLDQKIYTEANVEEKLDKNTKKAFTMPSRHIKKQKDKLYKVTPLMNWYQKDFITHVETHMTDSPAKSDDEKLKAFVDKYSNSDEVKNATIPFAQDDEKNFLAYGWKFNTAENLQCKPEGKQKNDKPVAKDGDQKRATDNLDGNELDKLYGDRRKKNQAPSPPEQNGSPKEPNRIPSSFCDNTYLWGRGCSTNKVFHDEGA